MSEAERGLSLSRIALLAALAAAIVLPVRAWVLEPIWVASASMEPTLPVGQRLFVDKLTLRARLPRRGELIVFQKPVGEAEEMVKRVIGLPGETVEIKEKAVFIDGKPLDEPYAAYKRAGERLDGDNFGPVQVPEGAVFVLGDNRDESDDSSVWRKNEQRAPFLPLDRVRGLVRGVY